MGDRLERIRQKLQSSRNFFDAFDGTRHIRVVEHKGKTTEQDCHPWVLNPCLTELQITQFEKQLGLGLPPEYRAFLSGIGNGGGGTTGFVNILTLEESKHYSVCDLHQAFKCTDDTDLDTLTFSIDDVFAEDDSVLEGYWVISKEYNTDTWLILNGPQTGEIWFFDRARETVRKAPEAGFFAWYEKHIDLYREVMEAEANYRQRSVADLKPKKGLSPSPQKI